MQFLKFTVVGGCVIIFEALMIFALIFGNIPAEYARFISFPLASFLAWALNRKFTFRSYAKPLKESVKYITNSLVAYLLNTILYFGLISQFGDSPATILLAICLSSAVTLFYTFSISRFFIFR